ncbi:peptidylprolyl isomerase [Intrasporangium oryzae NRRL B-24470]|uniref:Peptidylprolyl isomerase n=1 Tax=Intrasporangium oryzae NRRL B-24470 TaxID=1386089 RepID=W9GA32_9MICO|nr:DUF4190 domain-containing protein [Intrasporangium oryzae]EWT02082.1 peptidylprolyl isomerase [Intrasporangium oryzae NRRL B-24470]
MNEQPPVSHTADSTTEPVPGPASVTTPVTSPVPQAAPPSEPLTAADWSAPVGLPYTAAGPNPGPITAPPPVLPLGGGNHQGTNGLAIAALCCGLAGFFPITAVLALVFGIIALNQLRTRTQKGRGLAIAGIVLGLLATLFWGFVIAGVIIDVGGPTRDAAGSVTAVRQVGIDTLRDGDCFDGIPQSDSAALDLVTARPCTTPHEAQIVTTVSLPSGAFPGEDRAAELADKTCGNTVSDLIVEEEIEKLDLLYLYPATDFDWRTNRSVVCIVSATAGKLSSSVLR